MDKEKIFCMECKKELTSEKIEQCECGSKNFIFGNVVVTDKGFACARCGSTKFRRAGHMMKNPYYLNEFECCDCGAYMATEIYYESPYLDD